jgi:hypothetical protein
MPSIKTCYPPGKTTYNLLMSFPIRIPASSALTWSQSDSHSSDSSSVSEVTLVVHWRYSFRRSNTGWKCKYRSELPKSQRCGRDPRWNGLKNNWSNWKLSNFHAFQLQFYCSKPHHPPIQLERSIAHWGLKRMCANGTGSDFRFKL